MTNLARWDCRGWSGMKTGNRPEPNSTLDRAMELLLEKVRLVLGEQDWSAWTWEAREFRTCELRTIRVRDEGGASVRVAANLAQQFNSPAGPVQRAGAPDARQHLIGIDGEVRDGTMRSAWSCP